MVAARVLSNTHVLLRAYVQEGNQLLEKIRVSVILSLGITLSTTLVNTHALLHAVYPCAGGQCAAGEGQG